MLIILALNGEVGFPSFRSDTKERGRNYPNVRGFRFVGAQVVGFKVQRFTVNPDLAGFSLCFQSGIACFLDFVCQTVWHVKKSDEQGICLKNRAPPSLL